MEGSETQLCRFYLHIPLAGAKCASRKAIFQLFPFIKVSFAKIFPFEEPKNVKDFEKNASCFMFSHIVMQTTVVYLVEKKAAVTGGFEKQKQNQKHRYLHRGVVFGCLFDG